MHNAGRRPQLDRTGSAAPSGLHNVARVRDESGRVAARVRDLLAEQRGGSAPVGAAEAVPLTGRPAAPDPRLPPVPPVSDLAPIQGRAPRASAWERVLARVPMRLDPGRRAAVAVGVAVLVAALATGAWVLSQRPRALALSPTPSVSGAVSPSGTDGPTPAGSRTPSGPASAASGADPSSPAEVVVDVAGKVRHPGLHRLPPGSRVDDAIRAAGGPLPGVNLNSLNLAAKVVDGQQIAVGVPPAPGAGGVADPAASGGGSPGGSAGPVDLNTATLEQLEALPGVGPVLAQNILDWRAAHGRFNSVDQLTDVTGIGPAKFATLRPLVTT